MIADQLQTLAVDINTLHNLPGNPRRGDVDAVMRSYERFGQRKPIVAKRDGTVIAGNHQLEAARRLGWDSIAVVFVDDDDATAAAFALADNRTSDLGTYDDMDLAALLEQVALDPELLLATGYQQHDLQDLLARYEAPTLDNLEDKYGEAEDDDPDLRPTIKLKVRQEVYLRWLDWLASNYNDDEVAFTKLMDRAQADL